MPEKNLGRQEYHDLCNELQKIVMHAEVIASKLSCDCLAEPIRKHLDAIVNGAFRAAEIVNGEE